MGQLIANLAATAAGAGAGLWVDIWLAQHLTPGAILAVSGGLGLLCSLLLVACMVGDLDMPAGFLCGFSLLLYVAVYSTNWNVARWLLLPEGTKLFWVAGLAAGAGAGIALFRLEGWLRERDEQRGRRFNRRSGAFVTGLLCVFLIHGLLLSVNILADVAPDCQAVAEVDEKGRWSNGTYYIALKEKDSLAGERTVFPVPQEVYAGAGEGDLFWIRLHRGALGTPWLECAPA